MGGVRLRVDTDGVGDLWVVDEALVQHLLPPPVKTGGVDPSVQPHGVVSFLSDGCVNHPCPEELAFVGLEFVFGLGFWLPFL